MNSKYDLIVILGPTASGKTRFAAELSAIIRGEIISADSRQVYKKMDIGTGKDYDDYKVGKQTIASHLVDIREPGYKYNVYEYQKDFLNAYQDICSRNKIPVLCGGTGLYIEAVTRGFKLISVPVNKELRNELQNKSLKELEEILLLYKKPHNKTDTDTVKRAIRAIEIEKYYETHSGNEKYFPSISSLFIGIKVDRDTRRKMISVRLAERLDQGMVEEVKQLLDEGLSPEDLIYYGLEYKFITLFLTGKIDYATMVHQLETAIHQFSKRQMTWFRKMEREGTKIHWIDSGLTKEQKLETVFELMK